MPSRAYTSFLPISGNNLFCGAQLRVNALSGLYLISTSGMGKVIRTSNCVSMPSRAYASFLLEEIGFSKEVPNCVSMPSRAGTSFLRAIRNFVSSFSNIVVSMPSRAGTSFLRDLKRYVDMATKL